jgi:hypothetical protein
MRCALPGIALSSVVSGCTAPSVLDQLPVEVRSEQPCDVGTKFGLQQQSMTNFENAQADIVLGSPGAGKQWSYYGNRTGTSPVPGVAAEIKRCPDSAFGWHIQGGGYIGYGPNFGVQFGTARGDAVDLHAFSGFGFWAKATGSTPALQILVDDIYTFPVDDQSACLQATDTQPAPLGRGCYDGGLASRTVNDVWRLYTVDFSELKEDTWGAMSPAGRPDLEHVMDIQLKFPMQDNFDITFDDFVWFRR